MSINQRDLWPPFKDDTAAFLELYQDVTVRLTRVKARFSPVEQQWLTYLIAGFEKKYWTWESDPIVRDYLERVAAAASGDHTLQIIGHAFLHIAFDLPRVIADSLLSFSIPRQRARGIFQDLSGVFEDAFRQSILKRSSFGIYGKIARILNRFLPTKTAALIRLSSQFILSLRSGAWINAENLADGRHRRYLEECMWKEIESQSRVVMAMSFDPLQWMANLQSPRPPIDGAPSTFGEDEREAGNRLEKTEQDDLRGTNDRDDG